MKYILFTVRYGFRIAVGETDNAEVLRDWYKAADDNFYCNAEDWNRMQKDEMQ